MLRLRNDALAWREVDGEVVALELSTSTYLGVNRSGAVLFPLLAVGSSRPELVGALVDGFAVSPDVAERDVDSFLAVLEERGLLADAASSGPDEVADR